MFAASALTSAERPSELLWQPVPQRAPLRLQLAHFDAGQFDERRFEQAGIALPATLQRAVRKRRAEFFFGRLCARAALAPLALAHTQVGIGASGEPLWPCGVAGSITHSSLMAAAVVLPTHGCNGIGLDLEAPPDSATLQAMRDTVMSAAEYDCLAGQASGLAMPILMTLLFSAKESYFKACFGVVRRYFDFDALELTGVDLARRTLAFTVTQTLCPEWQSGDRCHVQFMLLENGHVVTVFCW